MQEFTSLHKWSVGLHLPLTKQKPNITGTILKTTCILGYKIVKPKICKVEGLQLIFGLTGGEKNSPILHFTSIKNSFSSLNLLVIKLTTLGFTLKCSLQSSITYIHWHFSTRANFKNKLFWTFKIRPYYKKQSTVLHSANSY